MAVFPTPASPIKLQQAVSKLQHDRHVHYVRRTLDCSWSVEPESGDIDESRRGGR